jgi:hypothetical protein
MEISQIRKQAARIGAPVSQMAAGQMYVERAKSQIMTLTTISTMIRAAHRG